MSAKSHDRLSQLFVDHAAGRLMCAVTLAISMFGCGREVPVAEKLSGADKSGAEKSPLAEADAPHKTPAEKTVASDPAVEALAKERRDLDDKVWAQERLSHTYDAFFVQMWDDLLVEQRQGEKGNQWNVYRSLPIKSLRFGQPSEAKTYDHGMSSAPLTASIQDHSSAEWGELLSSLEKSGVKLVQSDWHHLNFDPPVGDQPARSVVTFAVYGEAPSRQIRWVLQGRLKVTWSVEARDRNGNPAPESIDATEVQLLTRVGAPAFVEVLAFDPAKSGTVAGVQPVLLRDLNGDGLSEVVALGCNKKFVNQGAGQFSETELLDTADKFFETGVLADMDGDGHVDLISVEAARRNLLIFPGDAAGEFRAAAKGRSSQPSPLTLPQVLAVGDVDNDGDLDLWVAQYKISYAYGQMPSPYYDANDGFPAFLLRNDGGGKFSDMTEEAGLEKKSRRRSYGSSFLDLDDDGDLDLLVVSDYAGIDLYKNDGRGHFQDVTNEAVDEWHNFGMSVTFGDYNLDGRLDFYVTGMSSTTARRLEYLKLGRTDAPDVHKMRPIMGYGSRMYLAQGGGKFQQPEFRDQVARTGWTWGSSSFDFDNDGDRDIFVGNGHSSGQSTKDHCSHFWCHDIYTNDSQENKARHDLFNKVLEPYYDRRESWDGYQKNLLLMNIEGKSFVNIAFLLGVGHEYDARAVITDDIDGDGRMDLLVVEDRWRDGQVLHVYRNELEPRRHWIGVRLKGAAKLSEQGARVTLKTSGRQQVGIVTTGDSIHAQHAPTIHFGLGDTEQVESLEVRWSNGHVQRLDKPEIDKYHVLQREK